MWNNIRYWLSREPVGPKRHYVRLIGLRTSRSCACTGPSFFRTLEFAPDITSASQPCESWKSLLCSLTNVKSEPSYLSSSPGGLRCVCFPVTDILADGRHFMAIVFQNDIGCRNEHFSQRLDGFAVPERCWDIDIAVWGFQVLPCPSLDELCLDTTQEEQNERREKAEHRCDVQREEVCLTPFCMLNCRLITSTKLCPGMVRCRTFCNTLAQGMCSMAECFACATNSISGTPLGSSIHL